MARTKASVGAKISSGKSSKARCSATPPASSVNSAGRGEKSSRSSGSGGGNPVCPRETPKWQKPITNFFINNHNNSKSDDDGETAGTSTTRPRKNVIVSSDEDASPVKPKNTELDESIDLEVLSGENCHKLDEYYPKGVKGKGVGKKTKGIIISDDEDSKESDISETSSVNKDDQTKGVVENSEQGRVVDDEASNDKTEESILKNEKEIKVGVSNDISKGGGDRENDTIRNKNTGKRGSILKSEINGVVRNISDRCSLVESDKIAAKENVCDNIEKEEDNVEESKKKNKERNKRERDDRLEEGGNVSKKLKVT